MNFKNILKKQNIMPVAVLVSICLIVALLLAGINMLTAPKIEADKQKAIDDSLKVVLPEGKNFERIDAPEGASKTINSVYKADGGYVFELTVKGKDSINLMCGVDSDGKITGVEIISEQETPGYKEKILPFVTGKDGRYNGKDISTLEPDVASGATLSSNAIYEAVKASLNAHALLTGGEAVEDPEEPVALPKTDEQIRSLAASLLGVSADSLTDVTPEGAESVRRIYRDNGRRNYAVYAVVFSQHYAGQVETETLIHVGSDGVIKNINKLTWSVSPAKPEYGYNPPSDATVDAFYQGLIGKDSASLGEVDVTTGATNTTTNLVGAVTEAVSLVKTLALKDMPSPEERVIELSAELLGVDADELVDVTPGGAEYVKRIYRHNGREGYAVYVAVISEHYGTVETETILHVNRKGVIENVNKMVWSVSPAKPEYGYNPPDEAEVKALYDSLVGKSSATVEDVDVKTGATNTATNLVKSVTEALTLTDEIIETEKSPLPRILGIVILSLALLGFIAYLIVPKFIKRRKIK